MASQVNPNNIDGTYPVAGQDNDSQGFRDNFTNIRNNFTYIKAEVEDLQSKAILKTNLTNSTLNNDLLGNAIVNPSFTSWRETYKNVGTLDGTNNISFSNGNFQRIVLNSAVTLNFLFPSNTSGQYASIKLWVNIPAVDPTRTLTFGTAPSLGDPDTIAGYNAGTITFSTAELTNASDFFFEIWTTDGGTTLGIVDLSRNRDVDLSGMSITGNLTLDGLTVTTYNSSISGNVSLGSSINATTGSNVVIKSNVASTSTTTGALVVSGGVGVAGNINVSGNLISVGGTSGRINQNYAYITLTNGRMFFANTDFNTLFFDTASSATIANAWIALPSGAEDGREIKMSFLAPITAVWVAKGPGGSMTNVKWYPNTTVSSGNVTAKFTYSTAASNWLRSE